MLSVRGAHSQFVELGLPDFLSEQCDKIGWNAVDLRAAVGIAYSLSAGQSSFRLPADELSVALGCETRGARVILKGLVLHGLIAATDLNRDTYAWVLADETKIPALTSRVA